MEEILFVSTACFVAGSLLSVTMLFIFVFRQWWRVTLETGQDTCVTWTTPTATAGVSHAYIILIKTGLPRYVSDEWIIFITSL